MRGECFKNTFFLIHEDTDLDLDEEQKNIEAGQLDSIKGANCVSIVGPIFKRFLKSFQEPIILITTGDYMRFIPSKII